ncbi:ATP-binding protein [Streptomyces sp. NPDC007929]|uniref:ATP-binding protein n=1 Tax=unclassified Streptomyces TaxID=2593676 RepID=UPI0036E433F9
MPESVGTARRLVRIALAAWSLDDLADDGVLIVSELVSNAVQHARSRSIRVAVSRPEMVRVRIGVVDECRRLPEVREPREGAENGRGLALVGALAKDWGPTGCRGANGCGRSCTGSCADDRHEEPLGR